MGQYWEEAGAWPEKKKKREIVLLPVGFYIPLNVLWIQIPVQIHLPLCCQRFVRGWGRRGTKGNIFLTSLASQDSSSLGMVFSLFSKITPHSTPHLDMLLGTFGISEKCAIGNTKSPLLLWPSPSPCPCLNTDKIHKPWGLLKVQFQTSSVGHWRRGWWGRG